MKKSLQHWVLPSLFTIVLFIPNLLLLGQTCDSFSDLNETYFGDHHHNFFDDYPRLHFVANEYASRMLQFTNIDAPDFETALQQTANCFFSAALVNYDDVTIIRTDKIIEVEYDSHSDQIIKFLILSSRTIAAIGDNSNSNTVRAFSDVSAQKMNASNWIKALPELTVDEKNELYNILLDEFKQSHSPEFIREEQEFMRNLISGKDVNNDELLSLQQIPPKIQVFQLPSETTQPRQTLSFFVTKGSTDLKSLEIRINDARQPLQTINSCNKETKTGDWEYKQEFDLIKDKNTVIIKCVDMDGREACDTVTITYKPEDCMDRKDYAILFAVDDYSKVASCHDLIYPIKHAEHFAKILAGKYGFDTLIVRNPTRQTIFNTIKLYQRKEYGKCDQLLIFYAGHGYINDVGIGYIVPSDSNNLNDDADLVGYSSLSENINAIKCKHILFICDACHSGSFLKEKTKGINPNKQKQCDVMKKQSRLFLGSCLAKDETPDNSPFMEELFKTLEKQDKNTSIDFYSLIWLPTSKDKYTDEEKQKAWGDFGDHEKQGDFFFNRR